MGIAGFDEALEEAYYKELDKIAAYHRKRGRSTVGIDNDWERQRFASAWGVRPHHCADGATCH